MDDIARLGFDDARLASEFKAARHELRRIADHAGLDQCELVTSRDTPGDVGTGITTSSESNRTSLHQVAIAAGKRAGEALRVIEEMLKAVGTDTGASAGAKALRYRVYTLEQQLLALTGRSEPKQWRLCVLITSELCTHHPWDRVAELAIRGGADALQLREKSLDSGELLRRAIRLVDIAKGHASVIINDRPDIAALAGADGVHVGQSDLSPHHARRIVGSSRLVGVSTSSIDQAHSAIAHGADYCGVGPMFATTTKHKPQLAGPQYLRKYLGDARCAAMPHLAIGGISPGNIRELADAGCQGVAVSSAVCGAAEPETVCRQLVAAIGER